MTPPKKLHVVLQLLVVAALLLSGCENKPTPTEVPSKDLLAKILARGTLVISTDPNYPPQSQSVEGAKRAANTKCAPNEMTANQLVGFDIETGVEIAKRLGLEACFVTPEWSQIISGGWDGRWDISVGSVTITEERMKSLYFTQPYYATPAAVFVHKDNTTFSTAADLSGKKIGACTGCVYEDYLRATLIIPGDKAIFAIKDPQIFSYRVDIPALEALSKGDGVELDAAITSQPTGLQAIADGMPIKQLGKPIFFEYLSVAIDRNGNEDPASLLIRLNEIIQAMHADGRLLTLSQEYLKQDYVTVAGKFDVKSLEQTP